MAVFGRRFALGSRFPLSVLAWPLEKVVPVHRFTRSPNAPFTVSADISYPTLYDPCPSAPAKSTTSSSSLPLSLIIDTRCHSKLQQRQIILCPLHWHTSSTSTTLIRPRIQVHIYDPLKNLHCIRYLVLLSLFMFILVTSNNVNVQDSLVLYRFL